MRNKNNFLFASYLDHDIFLFTKYCCNISNHNRLIYDAFDDPMQCKINVVEIWSDSGAKIKDKPTLK